MVCGDAKSGLRAQSCSLSLAKRLPVSRSMSAGGNKPVNLNPRAIPAAFGDDPQKIPAVSGHYSPRSPGRSGDCAGIEFAKSLRFGDRVKNEIFAEVRFVAGLY